jgi:LytS/YehU family sensor histidine kinase
MEFQKQKEKTLKAMSVAKDAQLQMLRYQLNPHFLFNALNSIRTLVYEDKEKTDQVITDLSEFLRYSLADQDERHVSIEDEIEVMKNYLRIQKTRFEEKLKIKITIDEKILNFKIPCFLFHPLVENAMKYGIETSPPPLEISITGQMLNDSVSIKVQNSGVMSKPNDSTCNGTGLKNVKMRLNNYFPERNSFELYEDSGNVCAEITINMSDG